MLLTLTPAGPRLLGVPSSATSSDSSQTGVPSVAGHGKNALFYHGNSVPVNMFNKGCHCPMVEGVVLTSSFMSELLHMPLNWPL